MSGVDSCSGRQVVTKGEVLCCYYDDKGHTDNQPSKRFVVLTKISYSNGGVNELQVYASAKKWTTQRPQRQILITCDNFCGVVTGTDVGLKTSTSKKSSKVGSNTITASPFIVIVTLTGSVRIQQKDSSQQSIDSHDSWFRTLQQQFGFVHSWPVTLEVQAGNTPDQSDSNDTQHHQPHGTGSLYHEAFEAERAFLCLNKQTIAIVFQENYTCSVRSARTECVVKATDTASRSVRLTIKRTTARGVVTRFIMRTSQDVACSVIRALKLDDRITPREDFRPPSRPEHPAVPRQPQSSTWTIIDTLNHLYNGSLPMTDTLQLSHTCLTELGIKLQSQPVYGCWKDMAEHLGLTLDDVDLIVRWASSPYNVPRHRPMIMTPAIYLLYHWQFVYNRLGVGEPPKAKKPCTKPELIGLLELIGRNDLVRLIEEWERSLTRI